MFKSYHEPKVEMEEIQQRLVKANNREQANALKGKKLLWKRLGFVARMLNGSLANKRGKK